MTSFQRYEPPKRASTAYFWLFFFGTVGAHQFYLGRWMRGIFYACSLGLFWVGVIYDSFTLAAQVEAANAERAARRRDDDDDEPDYAGIDAMIARYRATPVGAAAETQIAAAQAVPAARRSFGRRG